MSFSKFLEFAGSPGGTQLGLSAIGTFSDMQNYKSGLNSYYDALQQQQDQFAFQKGGYLEAMRAQQEENEYQRTREGLDRATRRDEVDYQRGVYDNYMDQLLAERTDMQGRQVSLDRDSAAQQAFQLEQLLRNQDLRGDERKFAIEQLRLAQDIASSERDFQQDIYSDEAARLSQRQGLLDQDAKDIQLYRLREAARNRELVGDERAFAKQLLGRQMDTAASERAEQLARFGEDRNTVANNRQFEMDQYDAYLAQSQKEREDEMAIREMIMSGAGNLQNELERVSSQMGYVPEIEQITPEMIDSEVGRRTTQYMSDVDRAAEMVSSQGQADLIRRGMDVSTLGSDERAAMAARLADEYQGARNKAYDDALGYISGRSNAMSQNVGAIMDRRSGILSETAGIGATELGYLQNMRAAPSATGAYQMAGNMSSGILDRNISSAGGFSAAGLSSGLYDSSNMMSSSYGGGDYNLMNLISGIGSAGTYSSPVGVGTSIYDGNIGGAFGNTLNYGSAASTSPANLQSSIFGPYGVSNQNPMGYMSGMSNSQNNYISSLMGDYNQSRQALMDSSAAMGGTLRDFNNDWTYAPRDNNNNTYSSGRAI
jgi:hypothetical protein